MKVIESEKFREVGKKSAEILQGAPELVSEAREFFELQKRQSEVHKMIEERAGVKLTVVEEGAPKNAAAFVEHTAINSGLRQAYIVRGILGNPDQALHAAKHEVMHVRSGLTGIDLNQELKSEQMAALTQKLQISEDDPTFWLEGFNELATITENGKDPNCGYNDQEVPAAEKLERLSMEMTGISLVAIYKQGNKELFFDKIRALCDALLIENIRANLLKEAA